MRRGIFRFFFLEFAWLWRRHRRLFFSRRFRSQSCTLFFIKMIPESMQSMPCRPIFESRTTMTLLSNISLCRFRTTSFRDLRPHLSRTTVQPTTSILDRSIWPMAQKERGSLVVLSVPKFDVTSVAHYTMPSWPLAGVASDSAQGRAATWYSSSLPPIYYLRQRSPMSLKENVYLARSFYVRSCNKLNKSQVLNSRAGC